MGRLPFKLQTKRTGKCVTLPSVTVMVPSPVQMKCFIYKHMTLCVGDVKKKVNLEVKKSLPVSVFWWLSGRNAGKCVSNSHGSGLLFGGLFSLYAYVCSF